MSIIDTAKELLKKGIALNDEELIGMANSLLSAEFSFDDNEKSTPVAETSGASSFQKEKTSVLVEQFEVKQKNSMDRGSVPVTQGERKNTFVDDLTEHKDVITPTTSSPTERKRVPAQNVEQTCESCKKTFTVSPAHARDFYTCDGCLANKTKGK